MSRRTFTAPAPPSLRGTAARITAQMCADAVVVDEIIATLRSRRLLDCDDARPLSLLAITLERFAVVMRRVIAGVLKDVLATIVDQERMNAIRDFYLCPRVRYTATELGRMWSIDVEDVLDILNDELEEDELLAKEIPASIPRSAAVAAVERFNIFRRREVECALGRDFLNAFPKSHRTVPIVIYLPRLLAEDICEVATVPAALSMEARVEQFLTEAVRRMKWRKHRAQTSRVKREPAP